MTPLQSLGPWAAGVLSASLASALVTALGFDLATRRSAEVPFAVACPVLVAGAFAWAGAAALAARRIWIDGPDELGPDLARAAIAAVPAALVAAPFAGWLAGRYADALGLPATLGVARLGVAAGGTVIGLAFGAALFVRRRRHGLQEL